MAESAPSPAGQHSGAANPLPVLGTSKPGVQGVQGKLQLQQQHQPKQMVVIGDGTPTLAKGTDERDDGNDHRQGTGHEGKENRPDPLASSSLAAAKERSTGGDEAMSQDAMEVVEGAAPDAPPAEPKPRSRRASSRRASQALGGEGPLERRTSARRASLAAVQGDKGPVDKVSTPEGRYYRTVSAYPIRHLAGKPLTQIRTFLRFPVLPQLASGELIDHGVVMEHALRACVGAPVGLLSEVVGRKGEAELRFQPQLTRAREAATALALTLVPQTGRAAAALRKRKKDALSPELLQELGPEAQAKRQRQAAAAAAKLPPWGEVYVRADAAWNTSPQLVALHAQKAYLNAGLFSRDLKLPKPPAFRVAYYSADGFTFPLPHAFGMELLVHQVDFCLPYDIRHDVLWIRERTRPASAEGEEDEDEEEPETVGRRGDPKPPKYRRITHNIFVDFKPARQLDPHICECTPAPSVAGFIEELADEDAADGPPSMEEASVSRTQGPAPTGCGEGCLNRLMFIECDPRYCPCGEQCSNTTIQKRRAVHGLEVFWTGSRGFGLRTPQLIPARAFVAEYCGEVISTSTLEERMATVYAAERNYYFLSYTAGYVIDGGTRGARARFINHSCDPNCHIEKWTVDGIGRVGIFALRDIQPGEELTYDYKFEAFGAAMKKCYCGAKACRGYLGNNKRRAAEDAGEESVSSTANTTTTTTTIIITPAPAGNGAGQTAGAVDAAAVELAFSSSGGGSVYGRRNQAERENREFWRGKSRLDLLEGFAKDVLKHRVAFRINPLFLPRTLLGVARLRGSLVGGARGRLSRSVSSRLVPPRVSGRRWRRWWSGCGGFDWSVDADLSLSCAWVRDASWRPPSAAVGCIGEARGTRTRPPPTLYPVLREL